MSHEFRTPLNAIMGFTQILSLESSTGSSHEGNAYLQEIMNASNHLLTLINDILDLSRIESGTLNINMEIIDLSNNIRDCCVLLSSLANQNEITLTNNLPDNELITAYADHIRIKQVLINLISNAIKYNRPGGEVTISHQHTNENRLQLMVSDTGYGIPPNQINRVFESFNRLGLEGSDIEGTGIGLTITQSLLSMMNGSIKVFSEVNKGTTFTIELDTQIAVPDINTGKDTGTGENHHTMVICTDNPINFNHLGQITKDMPLRVLASKNIAASQDIFTHNHVDIILVDLDSQPFSPAATMQSIRESDTIDSSCPIIALSTRTSGRDIQCIRDAGFDAFLHSPLSSERLENIINRLPVKSRDPRFKAA
jgi:CheY-like chemotaxis protein/two-component sensor histidine kinase